jgi:2-hydroxy-3-keto-5-methylthiopentenyl-1-phosphate phosphatase
MCSQLKRVVFCDFDGTITALETFVGMLKEFTPELSAQIMPLIYERKLTLREGVKKLLQSIPSKLYPEIITYAESQPIRLGLKELLEFLHSKSVPFVVISGGLRIMVETVLKRENLLEQVSDIAAVDINPTSEYLTVNSAYESEQELLAKVQVMAKYPADEQIAIGDSVTDINMAIKADLVFARTHLQEYLKAENKPFLPWDNFWEIRDRLASKWEVS